MANKLPLVYLPDPLLRRKSAPIGKIDDDLQRLIDDMFFTMHEHDGIGLAGIQVAVPRRLLVIEMPLKANDDDAGEVELDVTRRAGIATWTGRVAVPAGPGPRRLLVLEEERWPTDAAVGGPGRMIRKVVYAAHVPIA